MPRLGAKTTKPAPAPEKVGAYFLKASDLEFVSSGCTILDSALGGGWALGRMGNIIGDKSTAKTGLAVEACANFALAFPGEAIRYREAEGAFDSGYGAFMGMPDYARFWHDDYPEGHLFETIEDLFDDIDKALDASGQSPSLYVVDSLDALSSREELKRDIEDGSYSLEKQKKLGELFRRLVRRIQASRMCLLIVSQVRDAIGVKFGEKLKRTGGRSMDFYATHCLWLSHKETVKRTVTGIKRATAIRVLARVKKNKVGFSLRDVEFEYVFGYGIDDLAASLEWLVEVNRLHVLTGDKKAGKPEAAAFLRTTEKLPNDEYRQVCKDVALIVRDCWHDVDRLFLPTRRKYE